MVDMFNVMWQCMGNGRGKPNAETKINMTTATEYTCSIGTPKKYEVGTLITHDSQAFIVTAWKHVGTRRFFTYLRTATQAELVNISWNRKTNRFQWVVASN